MKKEVGDLRVIAEALEKKVGIDSTTISEEVGDLCRIADAVEKLSDEGGGGGIKNPKLTITGTNTVKIDGFELYEDIANALTVENGNVSIVLLSLNYGASSEILECYVPYYDSIRGSTIESFALDMNNADWDNLTISNTVNCALDEDSGVLKITDPTQDASVTMVFANNGGGGGTQ